MSIELCVIDRVNVSCNVVCVYRIGCVYECASTLCFLCVCLIVFLVCVHVCSLHNTFCVVRVCSCVHTCV